MKRYREILSKAYALAKKDIYGGTQSSYPSAEIELLKGVPMDDGKTYQLVGAEHDYPNLSDRRDWGKRGNYTSVDSSGITDSYGDTIYCRHHWNVIDTAQAIG